MHRIKPPFLDHIAKPQLRVRYNVKVNISIVLLVVILFHFVYKSFFLIAFV